MKGDRKRKERIADFQSALRVFLLEYEDIGHWERFKALRNLAEAEHYADAFDSGVAHANAVAAKEQCP